MKLPPERILYTDPNGGQILGYTEEDMLELVRVTVRTVAYAKPPPPFKATKRQAQVLGAILKAGSPSAAAALLGCQVEAVEGVLASLKRRYKGRTTLQLCAMQATGVLLE